MSDKCFDVKNCPLVKINYATYWSFVSIEICKKSPSFYIHMPVICCVIPKIAITKSGNQNAIMKNGFSPFFMRLEEPIQFFQSHF